MIEHELDILFGNLCRRALNVCVCACAHLRMCLPLPPTAQPIYYRALIHTIVQDDKQMALAISSCFGGFYIRYQMIIKRYGPPLDLGS